MFPLFLWEQQPNFSLSGLSLHLGFRSKNKKQDSAAQGYYPACGITDTQSAALRGVPSQNTQVFVVSNHPVYLLLTNNQSLTAVSRLMKSREYDRKGPFAASFTSGVEANHSSLIPSTDSTLDHAQSDDALINDKADGNPNMSGMRDTEQMYTWLAGRLEGWKENDDYRTFFEKGKSADGLYGWGTQDGDYDDNGGVPLGVGQDMGDLGSAGLYGRSTGFSIGTVITRRI